MGKRVTQTIYECDMCGDVPEDGEFMWEMAGEYICGKCINDNERENLYENLTHQTIEKIERESN